MRGSWKTPALAGGGECNSCLRNPRGTGDPLHSLGGERRIRVCTYPARDGHRPLQCLGGEFHPLVDSGHGHAVSLNREGVEAAGCWSLDPLKSLHDQSHCHHHALHFCFDVFTTFFWHLTPPSPPCNVFVLSCPSITGDGFLTRYGCCSEHRRAGRLSVHSVTDLHQCYVPGKLMFLAFFQIQGLFLSLCFFAHSHSKEYNKHLLSIGLPDTIMQYFYSLLVVFLISSIHCLSKI